MRRHVLRIGAACLLLAAATARSAVIDQTAATITYDDNQTFGSVASSFDYPSNYPSFGSVSGIIELNPIASIEAASGQNASATSLITLTIKAKPGYALTSASFYESGSWATANSGTVDITGQGDIFDPATGVPVTANPIFFSKNPGPVGTTLTAGSWSFSGGFFQDPNVPPQREVTFDLSRTLFASGGADGNAIIGNGTYSFGGTTALNFYYTAQLVPEPATYAVLALGLLVLTVMSRKRR